MSARIKPNPQKFALLNLPELATWIFKIAILALVRSNSGCGSEEARLSNNRFIGPQLLPYVSEFELYQGASINFPVMLATPQQFAPYAVSPTTIGLCILNRRRILIDSNFWYRADENTRWVTIFHELGHCALGRPHLDDLDVSQICPVSLMRWEISSASFCINMTIKSRQEYINELFHRPVAPIEAPAPL